MGSFVDTSFRADHLLKDPEYQAIFSVENSAVMEAKNLVDQTSPSSRFIEPLIPENASKRNCYILKVRSEADAGILEKIENVLKTTGTRVLTGFSLGSELPCGYKICFSEGELPKNVLENIKWIEWVERDQKIRISGTVQKSAPWGLAALSSSYLERSHEKGSYAFEKTGKGVNMYLVDSGVAWNHPEFSGRAKTEFYADDFDWKNGDCAGHGTEVASVMAGVNVGVAKDANIIALTVLDCDGEGTNSDLILAMDWIMKNARKPCVVNMSVGGSPSRTLDTAILKVINSGIPVVVAAGNSNTDACTQSPSGIESAIVVGASTRSNRKADFSNFGPCVDIFAPGQQITVANYQYSISRQKSKYAFASGTSVAAPFVSGIIALLLEDNPNLSPSEISDKLQEMAIKGHLEGALNGSPNYLAQAPHPNSSPDNLTNFDGGKIPNETSSDGTLSALSIVFICSGVTAIFIIIGAFIFFKRRQQANR